MRAAWLALAVLVAASVLESVQAIPWYLPRSRQRTYAALERVVQRPENLLLECRDGSVLVGDFVSPMASTPQFLCVDHGGHVKVWGDIEMNVPTGEATVALHPASPLATLPVDTETRTLRIDMNSDGIDDFFVLLDSQGLAYAFESTGSLAYTQTLFRSAALYPFAAVVGDADLDGAPHELFFVSADGDLQAIARDAPNSWNSPPLLIGTQTDWANAGVRALHNVQVDGLERDDLILVTLANDLAVYRGVGAAWEFTQLLLGSSVSAFSGLWTFGDLNGNARGEAFFVPFPSTPGETVPNTVAIWEASSAGVFAATTSVGHACAQDVQGGHYEGVVFLEPFVEPSGAAASDTGAVLLQTGITDDETRPVDLHLLWNAEANDYTCANTFSVAAYDEYRHMQLGWFGRVMGVPRALTSETTGRSLIQVITNRVRIYPDVDCPAYGDCSSCVAMQCLWCDTTQQCGGGFTTCPLMYPYPTEEAMSLCPVPSLPDPDPGNGDGDGGGDGGVESGASVPKPQPSCTLRAPGYVLLEWSTWMTVLEDGDFAFAVKYRGGGTNTWFDVDPSEAPASPTQAWAELTSATLTANGFTGEGMYEFAIETTIGNGPPEISAPGSCMVPPSEGPASYEVTYYPGPNDEHGAHILDLPEIVYPGLGVYSDIIGLGDSFSILDVRVRLSVAVFGDETIGGITLTHNGASPVDVFRFSNAATSPLFYGQYVFADDGGIDGDVPTASNPHTVRVPNPAGPPRHALRPGTYTATASLRSAFVGDVASGSWQLDVSPPTIVPRWAVHSWALELRAPDGWHVFPSGTTSRTIHTIAPGVRLYHMDADAEGGLGTPIHEGDVIAANEGGQVMIEPASYTNEPVNHHTQSGTVTYSTPSSSVTSIINAVAHEHVEVRGVRTELYSMVHLASRWWEPHATVLPDFATAQRFAAERGLALLGFSDADYRDTSGVWFPHSPAVSGFDYVLLGAWTSGDGRWYWTSAESNHTAEAFYTAQDGCLVEFCDWHDMTAVNLIDSPAFGAYSSLVNAWVPIREGEMASNRVAFVLSPSPSLPGALEVAEGDVIAEDAQETVAGVVTTVTLGAVGVSTLGAASWSGHGSTMGGDVLSVLASLQFIALFGQLSLRGLHPDFVSLAGKFRWAFLEFTAPWDSREDAERMIGNVFAVVAVVVAILLVTFVVGAVARAYKPAAEAVRNAALLLCLRMAYVGIVKNTFDSFANDNGGTALGLAIASTLVYTLPFPMFIALVSYRSFRPHVDEWWSADEADTFTLLCFRSKRLEAHGVWHMPIEFARKHAYLFRHWHRGAYLHTLTLALRDAALGISVGVLGASHERTQMWLVAIVESVFFLALLVKWPNRYPLNNVLDSFSATVTMVSAYLGLALVDRDPVGTTAEYTAGALLSINAVNVVVRLAATYAVLPGQLMEAYRTWAEEHKAAARVAEAAVKAAREAAKSHDQAVEMTSVDGVERGDNGRDVEAAPAARTRRERALQAEAMDAEEQPVRRQSSLDVGVVPGDDGEWLHATNESINRLFTRDMCELAWEWTVSGAFSGAFWVGQTCRAYVGLAEPPVTAEVTVDADLGVHDARCTCGSSYDYCEHVVGLLYHIANPQH